MNLRKIFTIVIAITLLSACGVNPDSPNAYSQSDPYPPAPHATTYSIPRGLVTKFTDPETGATCYTNNGQSISCVQEKEK